MIAVLDASAAVKLVTDEVGSDQVRRLWDEELTIVAPSIVAAEVAAAIHAAHRHQRLPRPDAEVAQGTWASLLSEIDMLSVDAALAERARLLAATRPMRGMDAVYLAVASRCREDDTVGLLSFDVRQRGAVRPEDGIDLMPAAVG